MNGWRPDLGRAMKFDFPIIYKLIKACWDTNPKLRPSFNQIASTLDSWDGEKNLASHSDQASDFILRQPTESTDEENAIISQGIKSIFQRMKTNANINMMKIGSNAPNYVGTFTRKIPAQAWEVCELAFDWVHPEKMRRSYFTESPNQGDVVRKVSVMRNPVAL